jgi:hypothetical protein
MHAFRPGDRIEVLASDRYKMAGLQGTVKSVSPDLVFVELDKQRGLPHGVVIVDTVGDKAQVTSVFRPSEIRHVVRPTA